MGDATLSGTYVTICDWRGRVVWTSGKDTQLIPGEFAWEHVCDADRELAEESMARVVTLRREETLEIENTRRQRYRVWVWPLHSPEIAVCILAIEVPRELGRLTRREREILGLLAQGIPPRRLATRLDVSLSTIHTHLRRCRKKLGLDSLESLAGFAARYLHPREAPFPGVSHGASST